MGVSREGWPAGPVPSLFFDFDFDFVLSIGLFRRTEKERGKGYRTSLRRFEKRRGATRRRAVGLG